VVPGVVGAVQGFVLLWVCRSWREGERVAVLAAWFAFYILVLAASGAPVMARHFVPVIPSMAGIAAWALDAPRRGARGWAWGLAWVLLAANVAAVLLAACGAEIGRNLRGFITSM
jgi:hypothetical protein